jgi:hypothetical protein
MNAAPSTTTDTMDPLDVALAVMVRAHFEKDLFAEALAVWAIVMIQVREKSAQMARQA